MNGTAHSPNGVHANGTNNNKKRRFSETGMNDSNSDRIQTKSPPFKPQNNNTNITDERKKMEEHRKRLPIFEARQKIIDHLKTHNNLVIIGETGSGKTTQVCQYLVESGLVSNKAAVAVTQPRRVAARSVAQRVSQEVGKGPLGTYVGYSVRFEHVYNDKTRIKFLTDGMLLRELQLDPLLSGYEAIILDEAHERTLNTDLLFGLLKLLQSSKRPQLKIVVMSATLEADLFAEYFNTTVFYVQGRMFPIEVFYTSRAEKNYVDAAMLTVMQIHEEQENGDILVFMTGREEIETLCKLLSERIQFLPPESDTLLLVPLYGALTPELQSKVFEPTPPKARKVVVSTNIAETSITVPNIRYVIDPGVVKARLAGASITVSGGTGGSRDQVTPMTSSALVVVSVSRSQAWQRAGRCGRVAGGKVYRLYTEETFLSLPISFPAEIKRVSLETLVLTLLNLGHRDVLNFPYLQQPSPQALKKALEMLWILGALAKDGSLSELGKQMALFPLEPLYSRVLIASQQFKCTDEVITILALLSSENIFIFPQHIARPSGEDVDLTGVKRPFAHPDGDLLVLLNVYKAYQESGQSNHWCKKFNINGKAMKKAVQIREQLINYWQTMCAVMRKKANNSDEAQKNYPEVISSCDGNDAQIRKCFAAGFFLHAATLVTSGGNARASYQLLMQQQTAFIHPTSILAGTKPKCVIFSELSMLLPKELLVSIVEHLNGDGRSMLSLMLSCKVYFNWMTNDKLFDNFWKLVACHIRRFMNRHFIEFDDTEASTARSGSWYREVMELDQIKRNWRTGACRSRAVDMHNYGCLKFCKYDNKHLLVGSGNGKLIVMKLVEQETKGVDTETTDKSDSDATGNSSLCTAADRANPSSVSLRKKHKSNMWTLKTVRAVKSNSEPVSYCLPFRRSNRFVTGGWDSKVKIWDFEKLKPITRIHEEFGSIEVLDMYDDRQLIVGSSGADNSVQIYDFASQTVVARPSTSDEAVWQLELNSMNNVLLFSDKTGLITLYDVKRQRKVHEMKYYKTTVRSLKWQAGSEHQFYASTKDAAFYQWDTRRLDEPLRKINVPTARPEDLFLRLHQNEHIIAGGGSNGMVYIYDTKTLALLYMIPAAQQCINSMIVDEFNVYAGFEGGALRIYDFDVTPELVNVNPKTKITPKSMHKLIGMHGNDYKGHVY